MGVVTAIHYAHQGPTGMHRSTVVSSNSNLPAPCKQASMNTGVHANRAYQPCTTVQLQPLAPPKMQLFRAVRMYSALPSQSEL